jgi:hypothetical protein
VTGLRGVDNPIAPAAPRSDARAGFAAVAGRPNRPPAGAGHPPGLWSKSGAAGMVTCNCASGMTTMAANSSAVIDRFPHCCFVVCFNPTSPFTQYAIGKLFKTGCVRTFADIGTRRAWESTTEFFGASFSWSCC